MALSKKENLLDPTQGHGFENLAHKYYRFGAVGFRGFSWLLYTGILQFL